MIDATPPHASFSISDLGHRPEFVATIADRIWNAWWRERGFPLSYITARLNAHRDASRLPMASVAHESGTYQGSALVIELDLDDRPDYSPWVAAVWVDAEFRKQGIGAALVDHAVRSAFAQGFGRIYLCATRANRDFYLKRDWMILEEDVGTDLLTVMIRECESAH